ncbi:MAG: prepilin-type N-terminal cleavage/methylation domain-containing protein [Proteobacteria bacterium]|nr:prepilin-type N-terminal cleavage/methylation domain-containing protein [Pseudomonadota bacterium]
MNAKPRGIRSAGFSMLELMVALTAGAIAVSSIYYVGAASSDHFKNEGRLSQLQTSLRIAMKQVTRDLARAGFLATPDAAIDQRCLTSGSAVAVEHSNNADNALVDPTGEHGVEADRITLLGNYVTSDQYLIQSISTDGTILYLQRDWQAFRRMFTKWWETPPAPDTVDSGAVQDVFRKDRMLRIETITGDKFFVQVAATPAVMPSTATDPLAVTITVPNLGSLPVGTACLGGLGGGATVAPLARIEYRVQAASGEADTGNSAVTGSYTHLVRRELNPTSTAELTTDIPARVVLENVVHFNVEWVEDQAAGLGTAPTLVATPTINQVQDLRSAIVTMSVRSPTQDGRFRWIARAAGAPLSRFRFDAARPGAARVRTLRAQVLLPNIAYLGFR